jgi:hypothetical protein
MNIFGVEYNLESSETKLNRKAHNIHCIAQAIRKVGASITPLISGW